MILAMILADGVVLDPGQPLGMGFVVTGLMLTIGFAISGFWLARSDSDSGAMRRGDAILMAFNTACLAVNVAALLAIIATCVWLPISRRKFSPSHGMRTRQWLIIGLFFVFFTLATIERGDNRSRATTTFSKIHSDVTKAP